MSLGFLIRCVFLLIILNLGTLPRKSDGQYDQVWCVADEQIPEEELKEAMDWACNNGADCRMIGEKKQPCFEPNTVKNHASFAFNSYFQKMKNNGGDCYFNAAAMVTSLDPSYGSCKFDVV